MDINEIATQKDIARLEDMLRQILSLQSKASVSVPAVSAPTGFVTEEEAIKMLGIAKKLYGNGEVEVKYLFTNQKEVCEVKLTIKLKISKRFRAA